MTSLHSLQGSNPSGSLGPGSNPSALPWSLPGPPTSSTEEREAQSTVPAMLWSSRNWVMSLGVCGPGTGSAPTSASFLSSSFP